MGYLVNVRVISGADDGTVLGLHSENSGTVTDTGWTLTIGRLETADVCLTKDSYVSRSHARLNLRSQRWFLEDLDSKNGTFLPNPSNFFEDQRVTGERPLAIGEPFRVGRTWMVIDDTQPSAGDHSRG
jgi:pSer/pThr/pTyr-binding forkhead associated (FHA) protein